MTSRHPGSAQRIGSLLILNSLSDHLAALELVHSDPPRLSAASGRDAESDPAAPGGEREVTAGDLAPVRVGALSRDRRHTVALRTGTYVSVRGVCNRNRLNCR